MEYIATITAMSTSGLLTGDVMLTSGVIETYADAKQHIRALRESAENHSDSPVKVYWSLFVNRTGHMVEKCAIEWSCDNVRMTDVVWLKRGYKWL